jgi:KilA domain-containing protein/P63C domain-containing protein
MKPSMTLQPTNDDVGNLDLTSPNHTTYLIDHHLDEFVIHQCKPDGYFDATVMCRAVGKLFADYRRLDTTQEFLKVLSSDMGIPISQLIVSIRGGPYELRGTWIHPDAAIHLAQWCSPKFAVAVARWVWEWFGFKVNVPLLLRDPQAWQKTFQDEFFQEVFRLKGKNPVPYPKAPWLAQVIRDVVYRRLPDGVSDTLELLNPVLPGRKHRQHKQHQFIECETGQFEDFLSQLIGGMKMFLEWEAFYVACALAMP